MDINEPWWVHHVRRFYLLTALVATVAVVLSYYAGYGFASLYQDSDLSKIGGLWSAISACLVLNPLNESALKSAGLRAIASLIGSIIAMIFVYLFGYSIIALGFSLFFSVVLCQVLQYRSTFRTALITVSVIVIVGGLKHNAPWLEALSRFIESIIGCAVAVIAVYCAGPIRRRYNLFKQ
ncbi:MAG: FUSC family protein [Gammaproteobacteria bacterium]|nr:FUSC family protein [Gammaproteobacteria bacterium]MCH9743291.1 FUSC family protein [Gammaproteobacteria bacterium]